MSWQRLVGRALHSALRILPRNYSARIRSGPLRGKKWILESGNMVCWTGTYESGKQRALADRVQGGAVFFDIGAHAGFYTLLAAALVGPSGRVCAFEPLSGNQDYLQRHLALNGIGNVTLFKAAVSEFPGTARFQEGDARAQRYMGKLDDQGTVNVEVVALDDLHSRGLIPRPDYLKIDAEGAELQILKGARKLLVDGSPVVFLATHGPTVHAECLTLLQSLGYSCRALDENAELANCDEIIAVRETTPLA